MDNQTLILRGAHVVLRDEVVEDFDVVIKDGRIARVGKRDESETTRNASVVVIRRLDGLTLYPGFIDVHIHGAVGVDTMEATVDDLHAVACFLARAGVTAWLPTLVPAPDEDYRSAARAVAELMDAQEAREPAARALGLHYEGPFINSAQHGALRPLYFHTFKSPADLDALARVSDAVHLITVAPEIEGGIELVRELCARGWIVSIGHTRASTEDLDRALAAGARHMTHFMNAMAPLHHRAPGPIGWGLLRDDVTCDMIADGVHTDPLILELVLRCKTAGRLALISDAVSPAGLGDGEYKIWGETINVTGGRTANAQGSIAGSVITMRDALKMMLSLGVPAPDAALMASFNPARLLGVEQTCGSIEMGKRADLVALDEEGEVALTLVGGRIAFAASTEERP